MSQSDLEYSARMSLISWCCGSKMAYKDVQDYTSSHIDSLSGYTQSVELRQEKYVYQHTRKVATSSLFFLSTVDNI